MRINYWSCSKFADWIRGTPKLDSGTSQEWSTWRKTAKSYSNFRYWLAEEGLHKLQNFVYWPTDQLYNIKYYINNRWITKSHALTANPKDIKPGKWCDLSDRFLPCMFNELVNFVEIEQAWHCVAFDPESRKKFKVPFYASGWFRFRTWRCPEAGLEYLDWASNLKYDEEWVPKDDPDWGKPTGQALAAQEIKKLYLWWTQVYPNRPDPYEASGWSDYCESRRTGDPDDIFGRDDANEQERQQTANALDRLQDIEKQYEQEDEEMMIRLIRVRHHLWT